MAKILIISSHAGSLHNFRGDLITEMKNRGYQVYCAAPDYLESSTVKLKALGVILLTYKLKRKGINPISDLRSIHEIKKIIKDYEIDLVFPYTIKPVVYGSIAAKKCNTSVISMITGLGFTFSKVSIKARILQMITERLYSHALKSNKAVIFQNADDKSLFMDKGIISKGQNTYVVNGSGINLDRFKYRPPAKKDSGATFIMVSRLIPEKGTELYLSAAEHLKAKYQDARFLLVGSVPSFAGSAELESRIENLDERGIIEFIGQTSEVYEHLSKSDVFVLPTFYREGVPRSILEALSVGMVIITTDEPGCRETVIDGENGWLIKSKDLASLIKAMENVLINPGSIESMSKRSYSMAEEKFDVHKVNNQVLEILEEHS